MGVNARHATMTSMQIHAISPLLNDKCAADGDYKHWLVNYVAPTERFVGESKKDWEKYEKMFRDKGICPQDAPYVPYPYTCAYVDQQHEVHIEDQLAKMKMYEEKGN